MHDSLLASWWDGPYNLLDASRFAARPFEDQGIVPVGCAAFAFTASSSAAPSLDAACLGHQLGCLPRHLVRRQAVGAARFAFPRSETAILTGLAVLLVPFCFWWIRRHAVGHAASRYRPARQSRSAPATAEDQGDAR